MSQPAEQETIARTLAKPGDLKSIRRLGSFLRPYRGRIAMAAVALVIAASGILGIGQAVRWVANTGFHSGSDAMLNRMLLAAMAVIVVVAIATAVRFYFVSWIGERLAADLRLAAFNHAVGLDPGYFEARRVGDLASRIMTDTTLLETLFGSSLSMFVRNVFLLMGGVIMMFITSPKLTTLVLLGMPPIVGVILFYGRRVRTLSRASQDRLADVNSYVDETLHAIRTVQAFGHEPLDRQRFRVHVDHAFATAAQRIRKRATLTGMAILLAFGAVGVILWVGGKDVLTGQLQSGDLAAFLFYSMLVAGALGAISEVMGDLLRGVGAAERLFELLDAQPQIVTQMPHAVLPAPVRGEVSLEQVRFSYPARPETPSLEAYNLRVNAGERLALVGPSGAGKSTVIQLLLRFYDPQEGRILFDGIDIRHLDPRELRAQIGIVPQEPVLFAATASENIRYGRPEATESEIRAAAVAAHAAEFLDRLPQGFETDLGERGVRLSGGQRQRVAIARALLRNPKLLLLDEATSSLDAESERRVQEALEELMRGRTSIIIAHRLATILACDRIVVMDHGRIHAIGTHRQLLEQSSLYARLAALQFGEEALIAKSV